MQTTITKYDYLSSMIEDIKDYINDNNIDINAKTREDLYDELFCEDSITGNWTYDWYPSFEDSMLKDNESLFYEAMYEFWYDNINKAIKEYFDRGGFDKNIYMDWTIRCYLLSQAIEAVYDELEKK